MGYTIFHIDTKRSVGWKQTLKGAKISCRAWNKRSGSTNYAILDDEVFQSLYNKVVPTTNLMSGKTVWIREQDKGGCCDPATETYWSM